MNLHGLLLHFEAILNDNVKSLINNLGGNYHDNERSDRRYAYKNS